MQVAVVGHVEWVEFFAVDREPAPGRILRADGSFEQPAGGGGVAAVELARLAGRCTLFTSCGDDSRGARLPAALASFGVSVEGPAVPGAHRRGLTLVDPSGERTILVVGAAQGAVDVSPDRFVGVDAVYACKCDVATLRAARGARVLVATARILDVVREAGVVLDALVLSAGDPDETWEPGDLTQVPRLVARTEGERGGSWSTATAHGRWPAADLPGAALDAYGCGDSFAAGLTYALADGRSVPEALALAAERGALARTRRGAHG